MTGSPPGPITPGTCLPWLTVPNPTVGSLLASVLMHPPPNPASSANVVAVRFIDLPPAVGGPKYGSPRSVRVRTTFDFGTAGTLDKPGTTGRVVRVSLACRFTMNG